MPRTLAHCVTTCRSPQNRKFITYCTIAISQRRTEPRTCKSQDFEHPSQGKVKIIWCVWDHLSHRKCHCSIECRPIGYSFLFLAPRKSFDILALYKSDYYYYYYSPFVETWHRHCGYPQLKFHQDLWHQKTRPLPMLSLRVVSVIISLVILIERRLMTYRHTDAWPQYTCKRKRERNLAPKIS